MQLLAAGSIVLNVRVKTDSYGALLNEWIPSQPGCFKKTTTEYLQEVGRHLSVYARGIYI